MDDFEIIVEAARQTANSRGSFETELGTSWHEFADKLNELKHEQAKE